MTKVTSVKRVEPTFQDVRRWYEENLHPDSNAYDDQEVFRNVYHEGRWCGVFQCTSRGAQQLFQKAKPTSIDDIAILTSIYRPGPLAAHVDRLYLKAKAGEKYDWGHPLFEKVLANSYNLVVYQEAVMDLAEHVGGFPKDKGDDVRRAIMKRDQSKGEESIKAARDMEDAFVQGAIERGVPANIARDAYQRILWMAGYAFNRAHAVAYAIDSYMNAFLLTHHTDEWCQAYLESMSSNPDNRARAFGEVKSLGYEIVPIDINFATHEWTILPGKKFMPSLLSCKGVGLSAIEELVEYRPVSTIEEFLWNEDGSWRPSKFNKRAIDALIKVHAFKSLECVGEGRLFRTWRHMHEVVIGNMDAIKKSSKRDPFIGKKTFFELARALAPECSDEWSRREQIQNRLDVFGTVDVATVADPKIMAALV